MSTTAREPYKFLDFYDKDDRDLFFGRRRETELLVADIVVARLVVLFARTGTGKSSLLNAGVRPQLEALGFDTIMTRVGSDPGASVMRALDIAPGTSLSVALLEHVERSQRALVLFFDQFEEFFHGHTPVEARKRFITEIGALYRNRQSGVHVVFSLREDFLAEMDQFRDEIPAIFQKESQLRLRHFRRGDAREVIEGPTTVVSPPFSFDEGLVDAIVEDIPKEDELVPPVALQIVCDTLWREHQGDRITLQQYFRSGRAEGILKHRFIKDIGKLSADDLLTLERVYPQMSTEDSRTKKTRTISEVASTQPEAAALLHLVRSLRDLKLVRVDGDAFEWVSDYISELSKGLRATLQLLWLGKVVQTSEEIDDRRFVALFSNEDLLGVLDGPLWYFLLRTAAKSRDALGLWYGKAMQHAAAPWELLRRALNDTTFAEAEALRIIQYLGELGFVDDLAQLLRGDADRARAALRALGGTGRPEAVDVIRSALDRSDVQAAAIDALRAIGTSEATKIADAVAKDGRSWREVLFGRRTPVLKGMDEEQWKELLQRITDRKCAVLLGPEIESSDSELAERFADMVEYPFQDRRMLRVVDYVVSLHSQQRLQFLEEVAVPERSTDLHRRLASAPFDIYVTTAFSKDMEAALVRAGRPAQTYGTPGSPVFHYFQARHPLVVHIFGASSEAVVDAMRLSHIDDLVPDVFAGDVTATIALGFKEEDPILLAAQRQARRRFEMFIVGPPPELTSRKFAEERARDYFRQRGRREKGMSYYFGTPDDFLTELEKRLPPRTDQA